MSNEEALVEKGRRQQSVSALLGPSTMSHATGSSSILGSVYSTLRKGRQCVPAAMECMCVNGQFSVHL